MYDLRGRFFKSFIVSLICFGLIFYAVDRFLLSDSEFTADGQKIENKVEGELLVLLLGVDDDLGTGKSALTAEKGHRTDTMMVAKANFDTGKIEILSIPRDTRVMINGRPDKINHAHSYGGVDLCMKTVEEFLGIDLDYYIKVDFDGIKEVVDAIGGVDINVPVKMRHDLPKIHLDPGLQKLDGQKAHDFLRFRGYPEGDIGRVRAQQYFMKELAKQVLSPKNILRIDKLIKTYYDYADTNISLSTMVKYGLSANKLDVDNLRTEMIPGDFKEIMVNGHKVSYWIYDMAETASLVEDMFGEYSIYR